jgi:membrane protease YdiL (CAAX protease family)
MTASARAIAPYLPRGARAWVVPIALVAGLAVVVAARLVATRAGLDGVAVGAAFGLALAALAAWPVRRRLAARWLAGPHLPGPHLPGRRRLLDRPRPSHQLVVATGAGLAFGLALVGLAVLGPALAGATTVPGLGRPAAAFVPWVAVTILVASAEEGLLRGVLFDRIGRVGGLVLAVLLTSAVFALMHVPLYGWHVVPLDFAVGLALAGLRLTTRSLVAPAAAHIVADLATWWL